VERGTHESLLAQRGFYYQLYNSQFRANGRGATPAAAQPGRRLPMPLANALTRL